MKNTLRRLADILAMIIGLNPNQRIAAVLLAVAGIISLDWFGNITSTIIDGQADLHSPGLWVQLLALPLVLIFFYMVTKNFYYSTKNKEQNSILANSPPQPHYGVVVFLSRFRTFPTKLPTAYRDEVWTEKDLRNALESADVDWPRVLDHIQASNMQTALEAAQFHYNSGTLKTIWVLTTSDMKDEQGNIRYGTSYLAPVFEKILKEGLKWNVDVIYDEEPLIVPAYDVQDVFEAVRHVYETAPRHGIHPRGVISDITGGTVTMSAGMTLYCALTQRAMQYTATTLEPIEGKPLDAPKPYGIIINYDPIQRSVLRQMVTEEMTMK